MGPKRRTKHKTASLAKKLRTAETIFTNTAILYRIISYSLPPRLVYNDPSSNLLSILPLLHTSKVWRTTALTHPFFTHLFLHTPPKWGSTTLKNYLDFTFNPSPFSISPKLYAIMCSVLARWSEDIEEEYWWEEFFGLEYKGSKGSIGPFRDMVERMTAM